MIKSINPYTGNLIKSYKSHSSNYIDNVINSSVEEFDRWKKTSFKERKAVLLDMALGLKKNLEKHATMISIEMGKPISESRLEISKCVSVLKFYSENGEKFLQDKNIKTEYSDSFIKYEPLGLILGVMPWNFPYWQVFRFIAPALMAGNVCLLKHASNVTGCSLLIESLVKDSSDFKNIFNSLIISSGMVENVIKNENVKAVSFTGSEKAGSDVAMKAGKEIKKTVLELGGSDPFIVLEDADINKAAKTGVAARFLNTGQSCIAAKRFFVHAGIYDKFISEVIKNISNLKVGDPLNDETDIGPLAKQKFADELESLVQSSISKGAKCLIGGKKNKFYFHPTLLVDINENMDVFKYETFGPIFCITKIQSIDEAIDLANNTIYGLGGSIWTSDIEKGKKIADKIHTGMVFINEMTKSDPRLPFGGIKKSGYGVELSELGIKEFVNIKSIVVN